MHITPKHSCGWMRSCCPLRPCTVLVCILYLVLHTIFLVTNLVILHQPGDQVDKIVRFIDTNDDRLENSFIFTQTRPYIIQNSGEYLALPITVNIVLIIANILAAWAAIFHHPLLLLPWLALYLAYTLFGASLLVYLMVLLQDLWFKVLLFLVVAPLIVIHCATWLLVLRLHSALRKASKMGPGDTPGKTDLPPTMYTPEPHNWDQPLPIWALTPPQSAWDPVFLQQMDPRYRSSSRSQSRTRSQSSRSRSSPPHSPRPPHHSDSVSLSDKYGTRYEEGGRSEEDRYKADDRYEEDRYQADDRYEEDIYKEDRLEEDRYKDDRYRQDRYEEDRPSEYQTDGQSSYLDPALETAESESESDFAVVQHRAEVVSDPDGFRTPRLGPKTRYSNGGRSLSEKFSTSSAMIGDRNRLMEDQGGLNGGISGFFT